MAIAESSPFKLPAMQPPATPNGNGPKRELRCSPSIRDEFSVDPPACDILLSIVVFGASGDLAKKKTYPALFALFVKGFLPKNLQIIGYARSHFTTEELRSRIKGYLKGNPEQIDAFLSYCIYQAGEYNADAGYESLCSLMKQWESDQGDSAARKPKVGRLMYLALPPSAYPEVVVHLRKHCADMSQARTSRHSWFRIILEKPFGMDLASSEELADQIGACFSEEHLYRIDHYLGKELVQNMLVLRFANTLFSSWWNRNYVSNVQIIFKEPFGTEGRGGYFDQYGIIRDVIQNHLMQVLALLTMEYPVNLHPDDIRDEKVKVLRCIPPVKADDCILGQYTAANGQPGYLDDPTVPRGSKQATYAGVKLYIRNERWEGVPFLIRAGKAVNERVALVRMQLKTPAASVFGNLDKMRNELVIKFQPGEAIYAKMVVKTPGLDMEKEVSELDLTYPERYQDIVIPDAYERLILDCIRGDQQHFVRRDELRAAWAVFTPLLHAIDAGELEPEPYPFGSRGPAGIDAWTAKAGYIKTSYEWKAPSKQPAQAKHAPVSAEKAVAVTDPKL